MSEKSNLNQQQLRHAALDAMLLAVESQTAAVKSMDSEHSLGIENTFAAEHLRLKVRELVQAAESIVKDTRTDSFNDTRERIQTLATTAHRLKDEADHFHREATPRARNRYEQLLILLGLAESRLPSNTNKPASENDPPPLDAPAGEAPTDTRVSTGSKNLNAQAGYACLRAEVDEHMAFALQIHAICNLALEYALNAAAAESARWGGNI